MYILIGLFFLVVSGRARQGSTSSDVIWFPIEDIKNGYASSLGEVYVTAKDWGYFDGRGGGGGGGSSRRRFRSVGEEPRGFRFSRRTDDRIVFPGVDVAGEEMQLIRENLADCERSCPNTPEYNPVCGSDFFNYRNMGALKCSQLCGKDVQFAHFGVCGRGLPLIFKPSPRPPRKRRIDDVNRDNW